ncbi:MAG: TVP38/TMEM64 family protein [Acidobacteriota bacterium]|nr:MAG: TVP38/TMEM64 family protein [Acidobacteriota bacterium]
MSDSKQTTLPQASKAQSRTGVWRPLILVVVIVTVIILARVFHVAQYVDSLRDWIHDLGPWGPVVFVLIYAVAVAAALPGSALTIVAGALFGSLVGIVVVSIAATLGAALAFLIARYFAREATARWLAQKETFRKLDELTERHGATIVALTRLVPIFPFNLLNYGFGLTRVPFLTYVFWSWLCMLPGTFLYVVGADAVTRSISEGSLPWGLIAAVAIAAVVLGFLVRFAQRRLKEREKDRG